MRPEDCRLCKLLSKQAFRLNELDINYIGIPSYVVCLPFFFAYLFGIKLHGFHKLSSIRDYNNKILFDHIYGIWLRFNFFHNTGQLWLIFQAKYLEP